MENVFIRQLEGVGDGARGGNADANAEEKENGNRKGKEKGKGKYGRDNYWGNTPWAGPPGSNTTSGQAARNGRARVGPTTTKYPNGQEMCHKHHLYGNCNGWCGRCHKLCPNKKKDGQCSFEQHNPLWGPHGHHP